MSLPADTAVIHEPPNLQGVQLLAADYRHQSFSRHSHEGYAFGIIERGELRFRYLGASCRAVSGTINCACPGESHDGHGADKNGWSYRMFYIDCQRIAEIVAELGGADRGLPFIRAGVLIDRCLARDIGAAHVRLMNPVDGTIGGEECLFDLVTRLIVRHAEGAYREEPVRSVPDSVRRAIELIEDRFDTNLTLEELAEVAGLSRYHLVRVFNCKTGLTPHRYLVQVRVRRAEQLLRKGVDLAEVAYLTGFADQSHLNRTFKAHRGVTPGCYRNFIQDNPASPPLSS